MPRSTATKRYNILRVADPQDQYDTMNSYVVARVHGSSPHDALTRCVRGKGRCDEDDHSQEAGPVWDDLFDSSSWYVVFNADQLHDHELLKLVRPSSRGKYPVVVSVR